MAVARGILREPTSQRSEAVHATSEAAYSVTRLQVSLDICSDSDNGACYIEAENGTRDKEVANHLGVDGIQSYGSDLDDNFDGFKLNNGHIVSNDEVSTGLRDDSCLR